MEKPKPMNEGEPWSEMDVFDLRTSLEFGASLNETADFLMRSEEAVRSKANELGIAEPNR